MQITKENSIFLLGGHDLEMITIKELLMEHDYIVFDNQLKWNNAYWESYDKIIQDALKNDKYIVGIELSDSPKFKKQETWILIDHHNKYSHLPSSIEQICSLLNIKMTEEFQKVAINDTSHIFGLKSYGLTKDEIKIIREKDLYAQGNMESDFIVAEKEYQKYNKYIDTAVSKRQVVCIETALDIFEILSEKIDYHNVLIFNSKKLYYRGFGAKLIVKDILKQYSSEETNFYYGGINDGFIGIKEKSIDSDTLKVIAKKICTELNQFISQDKLEDITKPFSHHTFFFVFKWDIGKKTEFKLKTDKDEFARNYLSKNTNWEQKSYTIGKTNTKHPYLDYNEYSFYHEFVSKVIYHTTDEKEDVGYYFSYKIGENATYGIDTKRGLYTLKLREIALHIYETGIGILSFNTANETYYSQNDILQINEFGRRIYPQFLGANGVYETKNAFLPNSLTIDFDQNDGVKGEDFLDYNKFISEGENPNLFNPPIFLRSLFKETEFNFENSKVDDKVRIKPLIDDRMFVVCWYGNDFIAKELSGKIRKDGKDTIPYRQNFIGDYNYLFNDFWYKYIFGDADSRTIQNDVLLEKHLRKHTYARWAEYGSYFGITRDTMMAVTSTINTLRRNGAPPIHEHMSSMYYNMAVLCLAQRASILRFSAEISDISKDLDSENIEVFKRIKEVYTKYIEFVNRIFFREVTPQIQGTEMYKLFQEVMELEKETKDLESEFKGLNDFVNTEYQKRQSDEANKFSKIATIFLPATLIASILGVNFIPDKNAYFNLHDSFYEPFLCALTLIISPIFIYLLYYISIKVKHKNK